MTCWNYKSLNNFLWCIKLYTLLGSVIHFHFPPHIYIKQLDIAPLDITWKGRLTKRNVFLYVGPLREGGGGLNPLNPYAKPFFSSKEKNGRKNINHFGLEKGYPDLSGSTIKKHTYYFCMSFCNRYLLRRYTVKSNTFSLN